MVDEVYRGSIHIDAEPEFVYDYVIKPEALVRWMGDHAILDPRPGGQFTLVLGQRTVEGRYVELDPPRRLVITWGRRGSPRFGPGSRTLDVTFTPEGRGTRVSIVHSGLPVSERPRHALGWQDYMARLATVIRGGNVGAHAVPEELTRGAASTGVARICPATPCWGAVMTESSVS